MDTKEIRNELSHGKVNNMFTQVMEMLEDLNNKQPSAIEIDLSPITEKLNRILNKPETKDFTAEQQKYFSNWFKLLLAEIVTKAPNNSKINEIETIVKKLSELEQTKTVINEHHFKVDFQNMKAVTTMIVMGLVIVLLSSALYITNQPLSSCDSMADLINTAMRKKANFTTVKFTAVKKMIKKKNKLAQ